MHGLLTIFFLFFILLTLATVTVAQSADSTLKKLSLLPCYDIPRLEHIVIDGQGDDWGEGGFRVETLTPVDGTVRPASEHCASLRLGWDERGLLLSITMDNREWCESPRFDTLFERDSLEVYLAPYRGALDVCQWVIAPGMAADQPVLRSKFYDNRADTLLPTVPIQLARRKMGNSCRLEVLLPWRMVGVTPCVGREVAFQIITNYVAPGGTDPYHLAWYPALGAAFTSMKMHRLRLADAAGAPIAARLNLLSGQPAQGMKFRVLAPASLAGKAISLDAAAQPLAQGTLQVDAGGYAQAILNVPPAPQPYDSVSLLVEGKPADMVVLSPERDEFPSRALALEATVAAGKATHGIALTWPMEGDDTGKTVISRRSVHGPARKTHITVSGNHYLDSEAQAGQLYEYALTHASTLQPLPATSYLYAGREVPLEERRGTVVLIVEQHIAAALPEEIARLRRDLIGDGWQVIRHDVAADAPVTEVKALLVHDHRSVPSVNTVYLLGHVPVPYSGNICPDGHENDHRGAWPADVYYGVLDGQWTDTKDPNPTAEGRMKNIADDGKFDQDTIPAEVTLAVGRVDLSRMPAFAQREAALLRQYLDRDHAYRHKRLTVAPEALIADSFKDRSEGFAYGGWQSFTTLLGADHVREGSWFGQGEQSYLLMYTCGPGSFTGGGGLGSTEELAAKPVHGIFTEIFGSYFADWDTPDNFMRAVLCNAGSPLTACWGGRPHWYLHPMGMGATIGECARLTQNNVTAYQPAGAEARGIHIALLGDPTLRLHVVAPPEHLIATRSPHGMQLCWSPSPEQVLGYLVYRAAAEDGPYQRVNSKPIRQTSYVDAKGKPGDWYMVRALVLRQTPTGSYYNASQGIFAGSDSLEMPREDRNR